MSTVNFPRPVAAPSPAPSANAPHAAAHCKQEPNALKPLIVDFTTGVAGAAGGIAGTAAGPIGTVAGAGAGALAGGLVSRALVPDTIEVCTPGPPKTYTAQSVTSR